ncbi:MAG TPA: HEAT repeat domain-containing protein, partial [Planctomycetota bacterium]|nr:HEAT repeat domain-containing protein [Planctomycetota bacterium]
MKKLRFLQIIVIAAAVAVPFAGCKSKPKTELEKLIDEVATPLGELNMDAGRRLLEIGEPAVEALLKACFEEKSTKKQLVYAHVLARINAEPARMEACIKLLKEHKDKDVRVRAVDGLARHGASDEAVRMAMDIALNDSEPLLRSVAHRMISFSTNKKLAAEISKVLRKGLSDPEQTVREHAQ